MPCQVIQSWTFNGLVGAFLDLVIAYLLLCASAITYFASKFLALFGLCLPCPCNGLFGHPNSSTCWQSVLVDYPSEYISSVQFSVKSRFPFDIIWNKNLNFQLNEGNRENGCKGMEGESSSSSFQMPLSEFSIGSGNMSTREMKEGRFDIKGKRVSGHKTRYGLRRRRKSSVDNLRFSSISSHGTSSSDSQVLPQSPASVSKKGNESNEGSTRPVSSGHDAPNHGDESSTNTSVPGKASHVFKWNNAINKNKPIKKSTSISDDFKSETKGELCYDRDEKGTIRLLEQTLKEERAARAALCLELEKERSAAATAADEAMAMILRLQEEKAIIEMESRQYQRMIEEKSAYDLEEMNILKEILMRREREKHFLENEVETYRQMFFGSEQMDSDPQDMGIRCEKGIASPQYSNEDPVLILQGNSESIDGEENVVNENKFSEYEAGFLKQGHNYKHPIIDELHQRFSGGNEEINYKIQENEIVSVKESPLDKEREVHKPEANSQFMSTTSLDEVSDNMSKELSMNADTDTPITCDSPSLNRSEIKRGISRRYSDIAPGLPPIGSGRTRPSRRNSMSTVDFERFKIDNEVGWLRERLRIVQKGRQKLNISMGNREKEKVQLQLLENAVSKLRDIRQTTEPGRSVHEASLPPPSYKVMSKKRCSRSVSSGVHKSA